MVKTLVLVRHGAPEVTPPSGQDIDRRLTTAGARALRTAYPRVFSLLGDDPKVQVWSSPAVRALETAEVVAAATGVEDIEVHQSLYAQDVEDLRQGYNRSWAAVNELLKKFESL